MATHKHRLRQYWEALSTVDPADPADPAEALQRRLRPPGRRRTVAQGEAGVTGGYPPGFTLSLGVATFPGDADTPEGLLRAADAAELAAKRAGKNRVCAAPLAVRGRDE